MRTLATAALFAAVAVSAGAQNFAGGGAPPTMSGWGRFGGGATAFARPFARGSHGFGSYGTAFLGDPWFTSYPAESVSTPVPVIVLPAPSATQPAPEAKSAEPLLIEWQGDHYARFSGDSAHGASAAVDYSEAANGPVAHPQASPAIHPASVLVYRDGHREQVAGYSIVGGVLYVSGDLWKDGFWTRKIPLSVLDLPATIQANRAAGAIFELPSGPNVVTVGF